MKHWAWSCDCDCDWLFALPLLVLDWLELGQGPGWVSPAMKLQCCC